MAGTTIHHHVASSSTGPGVLHGELEGLVIPVAIVKRAPHAVVERVDVRELVRRGRHVRICVPYGESWLRNWVRRVAESRGP